VRRHAADWNQQQDRARVAPTIDGNGHEQFTWYGRGGRQDPGGRPGGAFAALIPSLRSINSSQDGLEEQTRLVIGYRLPPNYDVASLRAQLEHWVYEDGRASIELSFSGEEPAFQTTRTTPLARSFITAIRATGKQPTFKHKTGTSDMNVVGPVWGQNIVAYGPGDSRLDHTPQEHIHIDEYIHAIDVLELVLRELALQREMTL
jgi:N-acetyl-ornithine/N-acetyl-lysine deacetylase